jgi:hypothetical protein
VAHQKEEADRFRHGMEKLMTENESLRRQLADFLQSNPANQLSNQNNHSHFNSMARGLSNQHREGEALSRT